MSPTPQESFKSNLVTGILVSKITINKRLTVLASILIGQINSQGERTTNWQFGKQMPNFFPVLFLNIAFLIGMHPPLNSEFQSTSSAGNDFLIFYLIFLLINLYFLNKYRCK